MKVLRPARRTPPLVAVIAAPSAKLLARLTSCHYPARFRRHEPSYDPLILGRSIMHSGTETYRYFLLCVPKSTNGRDQLIGAPSTSPSCFHPGLTDLPEPTAFRSRTNRVAREGLVEDLPGEAECEVLQHT